MANSSHFYLQTDHINKLNAAFKNRMVVILNKEVFYYIQCCYLSFRAVISGAYPSMIL